MKRFVPYAGSVYVPVQVMELRFSEKEDSTINPFQLLVLEAIGDGYSVQEIADATLLTVTAIDAEISQLFSQKLICMQDSVVSLSALSRRILFVSRCVQRLNDMKTRVGINLITGEIQEYDETLAEEYNDGSIFQLRPKIQKHEIDGIGIDANVSFFKKHLHVFDDLDDADTDTFLSSVYVEFLDTGKRIFPLQPVSHLPCLIGEETIDQNGPADIYVSGTVYQIPLSFKLDLPGSDHACLPYLPALADAGFLSEKGMLVAKAISGFQHNGDMTVYYDCVSGRWQFDPPPAHHFHADHSQRTRKINLELPVRFDLTEDIRQNILHSAHDHWHLPDGLTLEFADADLIENQYTVKGALWENNDV